MSTSITTDSEYSDDNFATACALLSTLSGLVFFTLARLMERFSLLLLYYILT